jgi:nitrogen regulatory protein P-II 1
MKKVEAIICPSDVTAVKEGLDALGIDSISITEIVGDRRTDMRKAFYRGSEYRADRPKLKVEFLVTDQLLGEAVQSITNSAEHRSGEHGMISVLEVADVNLLRQWLSS